MMNSTILDIAGTVRGMAGFAAILFAPGFLVGWLPDLFGFRGRGFLEQTAWAVALSFAVSPIVTILLGSVVPLGGVAAIFALVAGGAIVALVMQPGRFRIVWDRSTILLLLFIVVGIVVLVGSLVDIQRGNRLYLSVSVLDQAYRVAFTNGIFHSGIPPVNPLYRAGGLSPMRYYYFWYALCAVCMKLAHVSARQALMASSCWVGIGLVASISLYARHFLEVRDRLNRFILAGSLLLMVTGLDLLPVSWYLFAKHDFRGDLEWWSIDQVSSWFDSIAWVPHHTASLLCCLTALLLLWRTRQAVPSRDRIAATVLAGAAAASALGLSIYVSTGFAMLMAGWMAILIAQRRETAFVMRVASAVGLAGGLALPYVRSMVGSHSGTQGGASAGPSHLFQFGVRKMIDSRLITRLPALHAIHHSHPVLLEQAARLVLLLPGYALELGLYGFVLLLATADWRRLTLPYRTAVGLAVAGLVLVSFVRSAVIGSNDFGFRAALIPSFFLLLVATERLTRPKLNPWLALFLLVGLAGSGFQILMLRVFVPLHVAAGMPGYIGLPQAAFEARRAYASAARASPLTAVVQANPLDPENYFSIVNMLFSERSMVTDAAVDCGAVFGGDPSRCPEVQTAVRRIFVSPSPSAEEAIATCNFLGIDELAVAPRDPAWEDTRGWVWSLPVVGQAEKDFRVVQCGTTPPTSP